MKITHVIFVLVLTSCVILVSIGPRWLGDRAASASTLPTPVEKTAEGELPVTVLAKLPADREELSTQVAAVDDSSLETAVRTKDAASYAFLPAELHVLSAMIPERLESFDAATPVERLYLGRELLAHSIAVIMCARGTGPVGVGMPGDADLSFTGQQGGKWAFQVNTSTFHFYEHEFPEYPKYIALLRSAYDEEMVPIPIPVELPEDLAQRIRRRAREALAWL